MRLENREPRGELQPWETLGVPEDATADEIKKAFGIIAKNYHPASTSLNNKAEDPEKTKIFQAARNAKEAMMENLRLKKMGETGAPSQETAAKIYEKAENISDTPPADPDNPDSFDVYN